MGIVWYIPYYGVMQDLYHQPQTLKSRGFGFGFRGEKEVCLDKTNVLHI